MKFSREFIDKVRDANNIVDLIGEHTQLKRMGHRASGLCPFPSHREKTPSFSVSEDKQLYYCFGCKKSGNIFTFLEEMQGLSFPEAVEFLARRASIPLPLPADSPREHRQPKSSVAAVTRSTREQLWRLNQFSAVYFHRQLKTESVHPEAADYCRRRGIREDTIKRFQVGYAPNEWQELTQYLQKLKAPLDLAEHLGLVRRRGGPQKDGYYDLFRHRLIFPIRDVVGNFIGFGGRALGDDNPKYLNSPESEVFSKGKVLYGLNETSKFIRSADKAVVVEGYMDFLALYQAGVHNVVATLGTALTTDHARILRRLTRQVIVFFDGDSAGQAAAERSLPILLGQGLLVQAIVPPAGQDPDDWVRAPGGTDQLLAALEQAPDLFSLVLERVLLHYGGSAGDKVRALDTLMPVLQSCADHRLRDLYAQELADRLLVETSWLQKQMTTPGKAPIPGTRSGPGAGHVADTSVVGGGNEAVDLASRSEKIRIEKPPRAELFIVNLALKDEKFLDRMEKDQIVESFSHSGMQELGRRLLEGARQDPGNFDKLPSYLMNFVENPGLVSLFMDAPFSTLSGPELDRTYQDCVRQVKEREIRKKTRELATALRQRRNQAPNAELERIMNMQKARKSLHQLKGPDKDGHGS